MSGYIYLSAAHKSSGKTTLSIGLTAALHARGIAVQAFKKGPDYIDPLWLEQSSGRPCYNLDFNTQTHAEIRSLFAHGMRGGEMGLIEGNKGLYDGMDLAGSDSNAGMAKLLDAPVVLVLDTQGMTRGVAPLVLGYQAFDPAVRIGGVILNKVGGSRHEGKLRETMEHYTDVPVLGAVHRDPELAIAERHLGLVPANEAGGARTRIDYIAGRVASQVDLDGLLQVGAGATGVPAAAARPPFPVPDVRIAVARDSAFGFYYRDDLEALQRAGAELVPFSPLDDSALPPCDAVFLGGGFPETHLQALAANESMKASMREFVERDGPVYAECGGLMYLARTLTWEGNTGKMAGLIPADVVMHERPLGRGYVRLAENDRFPWPRLGDEPREFAAHEFHYSGFENTGEMTLGLDVKRGFGVDGRQDGICYRNLLANYVHRRDSERYPWCERFVSFVRHSRDSMVQAADRQG